jgi:hypothetical protein
MELTIRKLRRNGVEVVSMTQPTATDPSQEMMRRKPSERPFSANAAPYETFVV